jgi:hypothetical protein
MLVRADAVEVERLRGANRDCLRLRNIAGNRSKRGRLGLVRAAFDRATMNSRSEAMRRLVEIGLKVG